VLGISNSSSWIVNKGVIISVGNQILTDTDTIDPTITDTATITVNPGP
jgi:hypothetical protein